MKHPSHHTTHQRFGLEYRMRVVIVSMSVFALIIACLMIIDSRFQAVVADTTTETTNTELPPMTNEAYESAVRAILSQIPEGVMASLRSGETPSDDSLALPIRAAQSSILSLHVPSDLQELHLSLVRYLTFAMEPFTVTDETELGGIQTQLNLLYTSLSGRYPSIQLP